MVREGICLPVNFGLLATEPEHLLRIGRNNRCSDYLCIILPQAEEKSAALAFWPNGIAVRRLSPVSNTEAHSGRNLFSRCTEPVDRLVRLDHSLCWDLYGSQRYTCPRNIARSHINEKD